MDSDFRSSSVVIAAKRLAVGQGARVLGGCAVCAVVTAMALVAAVVRPVRGQTQLVHSINVRAPQIHTARVDVAFVRGPATLMQGPPSAVAHQANGQRLFALYGCSECHLSRGQGARNVGVRVGPPRLPAEAFISYVREPIGEMPPYTEKTVSNQELMDMYAFLKSVPESPVWKTVPLLSQ